MQEFCDIPRVNSLLTGALQAFVLSQSDTMIYIRLIALLKFETFCVIGQYVSITLISEKFRI